MKRSLIAVLILVAACGTEAAAPTTTTPAPEFVDDATVEVGDRFTYTMSVTCGEAFRANDAWWVASEKLFEHPNYPSGWPVEVLNQSPADGPDALIEGVLEVVAADRIEFNLADGTPVAVFSPGDPLLCG